MAMRGRVWAIVSVVLVCSGCGDSSKSSAASDGSGGSGATSAGNTSSGGNTSGGTTTDSAGGGSGGAQATSTGATTTGGVVETVELPAQPECERLVVACNGQCLEAGDSNDGCTLMANANTTPYGMTAANGVVYYSGFPTYQIGEETAPPSGIYSVDATSFEETLIDPEGNRAEFMAVDGDTLFYMVEGSGSAEPGAVRALSLAGGTASNLVEDIATPSDLIARDGTVYYVADLAGSGELPTVRYVSAAGGEAMPTEFSSVNRIQANEALLAGTWNGNVDTAPLPALSPVVDVVGQFQLERLDWWLGEEFVYYQIDADYKRLPLSSMLASEEDGELVQTFPATMSVRAAIGDEVILTAGESEVTAIYTMPIEGGTPKELAVIGAGTGSYRFFAADSNYVYVNIVMSILRIER